MKKINEVYIVKENDFSVYEISSLKVLSRDLVSNFKVLINDVIVNNYTISNNVLDFVESLKIYDKINIEYCILNNVKIVTGNSYNNNSMFKKHTSSVNFRLNSVYSLDINIEGENDSVSFITKFDPYYSTISKIRTDTGDLLRNVADESIAKYIHLNSKETFEKFEDEVPDVIPTFAKNYVRYKTCLDFINAIYLSISGKYGTINKILGDVEIDKEINLPYIKDMQARFKELLQVAEGNFSDIVTSASTRKGNSSSYPYERNFF